MSEKKPFLVELPFEVKTYEIDFAGIVSNIVYIRWLEDLRLEILKREFPLEHQLQQDIAPILVQTNIEYRRPVRMFQEVKGEMWMEDLTARTWVLQARFYADGVETTRVQQTGVFVNLSSGRSIPIPSLLREKFEQERGK